MVPPEAAGELYAYPYRSKATILQNQLNRVRMLGSDGVAVKRVYSVALPPVYRDYDALGSPDRRLPATLGISWTNDEASGLGLPLPAGAVRVYEPSPSGGPRYVGAATIGNTPKGTRVSLELSNVFDVDARLRQTATARVDKTHTSRSIEVTLRNAKPKPVEVRVVGPFGERVKIATESTKSARLDATTAEWRVTVPAGGETKLTYTAVLGP